MYKFFFVLLLPLKLWSQEPDIQKWKNEYPKQNGKEKVETLCELIRFYGATDPNKAVQYGKKALAEAEKMDDEDVKSLVYTAISDPYFYLGDYENSILYSKKALSTHLKKKDTAAYASDYSNMADAYFELGKNDEALSYYLDALKLFKQINNSRKIGFVTANIGNVYDRNGQIKKALEFHLKGIDLNKKNGYMHAVAAGLTNAGNCYNKLKEYKKAKGLFLQSEKICMEMELQDYLAGTYQGLGVNAKEQHKIEEALAYFEQSLVIYQEIQNVTGELLSNVDIAICLAYLKQLDEAEKYIQKAEKQAKETESSFNYSIVYNAYGRVRALQGDLKDAERLFGLATQYQDSIYNQESNQAIADMRVKYETEEKESELEIAHLTNQKKTNGIIALLLLLGFLTLLILYIIGKRKKDLSLVKVKNLENIEKERVRIARDLHDHLGAELTLISSRIDLRGYQETNVSNKEELAELAAMTRNANDQLRETIWSINKTAITVDELGSKIEEYANRLIGENDIALEINLTDENQELRPNVALNLYRIVQEILHNAKKYAEASKWSVDLSAQKIQVKDDGLGFDEAEVAEGYGLKNMDQRALEIQFNLTRVTAKGAGTAYTLNAL